MALDDEIARQLDREHIVAEMLEDAGFRSMEAAERQRTMSSMLCCDWLFQSAILPSYVHHEYFDLLVFENLFARCGTFLSDLSECRLCFADANRDFQATEVFHPAGRPTSRDSSPDPPCWPFRRCPRRTRRFTRAAS